MTRLRGIRIYDKFNNEDLLPYRYIYSELFSCLLDNENIESPGYQEIYIMINSTIENAKEDADKIPKEKWFTCTWASINIEEYRILPEKQKDSYVFNAITEGLCNIVSKDSLDKEKIERVISKIKEKGVDTEALYLRKDYKDFTVEIRFKIPFNFKLKEVPLNLYIKNKKTNEWFTEHVADLSLYGLPLVISKISLKENIIKITGRTSAKADITREINNSPKEFSFEISKLKRISN